MSRFAPSRNTGLCKYLCHKDKDGICGPDFQSRDGFSAESLVRTAGHLQGAENELRNA